MKQSNKKQQISVLLPQDTINKLSAMQKIDENISSRNIAIEKAVDFYYAYLNSEISQSFLCSVYGQKVEGVINNNTDRLSRLLFKTAVETNILTRLIATNFDIDKDTYDRLRRRAVEDAKATKGIISVYEAQK